MTTSASPVLLTLILILIIVIATAQFAFFFWVFRKMKRDTPPTTPAQFNFICKIIAGSLFAIAAALAIYSTILVTTGIQTTGIVVDLQESRDKEGGDLYFAPTFSFVDVSGVTNTVKSSLSTSPAAYRIGDRVPIIYRKSNPSMARINRFKDHWMPPIGLSAFGLVALISMPIYRKWRELGEMPANQ
jgi:hypothetical protein